MCVFAFVFVHALVLYVLVYLSEHLFATVFPAIPFNVDMYAFLCVNLSVYRFSVCVCPIFDNLYNKITTTVYKSTI